ncbi:MAG: hypothetical protein P4M00_00440 [Azospirillaceae bacterium]|nr:hypothetical protein [Azospirillaceae bacterium]
MTDRSPEKATHQNDILENVIIVQTEKVDGDYTVLKPANTGYMGIWNGTEVSGPALAYVPATAAGDSFELEVDGHDIEKGAWVVAYIVRGDGDVESVCVSQEIHAGVLKKQNVTYLDVKGQTNSNGKSSFSVTYTTPAANTPNTNKDSFLLYKGTQIISPGDTDPLYQTIVNDDTSMGTQRISLEFALKHGDLYILEYNPTSDDSAISGAWVFTWAP